MGDELAELAGYEQQLADVERELKANPKDEERLALRKELQEIIELTRDVLGLPKTVPEEPQASAVAAQQTKPRAAPSGIAQVARRLGQQDVAELGGWRVGDKCVTIFLGDGAKYGAVVTSLKPETQSAIVTFVTYLNQQDTPLVFLERAVASEAGEAKPEAEGKPGEEKRRKKDVVIKATDAPEVVEKKKRLLKKQKREVKQAEKDAETDKKLSSWKSFQTGAAGRPVSAAAVAVRATKQAPPSSASAGDGGAKGVRQRWERGKDEAQ